MSFFLFEICSLFQDKLIPFAAVSIFVFFVTLCIQFMYNQPEFHTNISRLQLAIVDLIIII